MVSISALQKKLIVASHGQLSMTSTVLIHSKRIKIRLLLVSCSRFLYLQLYTNISTHAAVDFPLDERKYSIIKVEKYSPP